MVCRCKAEISENARYCPHCGDAVDYGMTQGGKGLLNRAKPTRLLSRNGSPEAGQRHTGETNTLRDETWQPPLPTKYRATLEVGTRPEVIIWELFKHKSEMRNLLEALVVSWPSATPNKLVERAREYLQSHCIICGERTSLFEEGKTPLCVNCNDL